MDIEQASSAPQKIASYLQPEFLQLEKNEGNIFYNPKLCVDWMLAENSRKIPQYPQLSETQKQLAYNFHFQHVDHVEVFVIEESKRKIKKIPKRITSHEGTEKPSTSYKQSLSSHPHCENANFEKPHPFMNKPTEVEREEGKDVERNKQVRKRGRRKKPIVEERSEQIYQSSAQSVSREKSKQKKSIHSPSIPHDDENYSEEEKQSLSMSMKKKRKRKQTKENTVIKSRKIKVSEKKVEKNIAQKNMLSDKVEVEEEKKEIEKKKADNSEKGQKPSPLNKKIRKPRVKKEGKEGDKRRGNKKIKEIDQKQKKDIQQEKSSFISKKQISPVNEKNIFEVKGKENSKEPQEKKQQIDLFFRKTQDQKGENEQKNETDNIKQKGEKGNTFVKTVQVVINPVIGKEQSHLENNQNNQSIGSNNKQLIQGSNNVISQTPNRVESGHESNQILPQNPPSQIQLNTSSNIASTTNIINKNSVQQSEAKKVRKKKIIEKGTLKKRKKKQIKSDESSSQYKESASNSHSESLFKCSEKRKPKRKSPVKTSEEKKKRSRKNAKQTAKKNLIPERIKDELLQQKQVFEKKPAKDEMNVEVLVPPQDDIDAFFNLNNEESAEDHENSGNKIFYSFAN